MYFYDTSIVDDKAVCIDGTPGAYAHIPAKGSDSTNKWIIYMEGGGVCTDEKSCLERAKDGYSGSTFKGTDITFLFPDPSNASLTMNAKLTFEVGKLSEATYTLDGTNILAPPFSPFLGSHETGSHFLPHHGVQIQW